MSRHVSLSMIIVTVASVALVANADEPSRPWPFAARAKVSPPAVQATEWGRNAIDQFVLAALEAKGLHPATEASQRTLIRRLYFDLIGLPPTPEEVDAFVADTDPQAYEKLVERLLEDKRYGERWARLWLDLARYADTAGYEGDPDLPHAWRYRDYVIDAFNSDKPYDLFIKEQIAGDEFNQILGAGELPQPSAEQVVAMTFLRLAPFTEPRGDETRHEMLSEMTETVSSVFLGLTVGCAKCHDHKYDEIPTKDFYRMKAFFATVSIPPPARGDAYQIGGPLPAKFYRSGEAAWVAKLRTQLEQELRTSKAQLQQLTTQLQRRLGAQSGFGLQAMGGGLGNDYLFEKNSVNDGQLHWSVVNANGKQWDFHTDGKGPVKTGSAAGSNQGKWFGDMPRLGHISLGQYSAGSGQVKSGGAHHVGRFGEILIYDHPLTAGERETLGKYVAAKYQQGATATPPQTGLQFWLDAAHLAGQPTEKTARNQPVALWTDRIGGLTLRQDKASLQPSLVPMGKSVAVEFDDDFLVGALSQQPTFSQDQQGAIVAIYSASHAHEGYGFEVGGNDQFISTFINPTAAKKGSVAAAVDDPSEKRISQGERQQYRYLATRATYIPQHLKRLQPVAMSLRHSFGPPYEPGVPTSRVMIRGEYDHPGEVVEPGFLSCVTGNQEPARIRLDPFKRWPTRSRRMALAQWIAQKDHPLTARVMVNRLWHWHFGRGIVSTPSDFGNLSGGASHPELLDWLANRFVEKWSVKSMHRLMVTSSTYRQASQAPQAMAEEIDPENALLWRFRPRRLEAEAVRDAVLSVSGRLNPEQFGLPIFPPLPGDIEQRVKYDNSKWDTQHGPEGRKRSIYIYQQRTLTMPMLQSFDAIVCDQSRPRRRTSVTPLQALAMYNGRLVQAEAPHFAARIRAQAEGTEEQIAVAFQLAFGREPSETESRKMQQFMERIEAPGDSLTALCRILYNSNEFIYVD